MENLHLKNLNKPNGKYLFDKLYDLKENFKNNQIDELISNNLKKDIIHYIHSKQIKNKEIQEFINQFAKDLINNDIQEEVNIAFQIITYLHVSKITKIDIKDAIEVYSTLLVSLFKHENNISFERTHPIKFKNSFKYIFKLRYNNISNYYHELKITLYSDEEQDLFKVIKIDSIKYVNE